jgi:phosphate transport system substrate-binding protein
MEKKALIAIGVVAAVILAAGGVAMLSQGEEDRPTTLKQQGSDTLLELMTAMSESFNYAQDDVRVDVTGGGSGVGIESLIRGTIDVAQASRQMKQTEIDAAKANNIDPLEFSVAIDGIAIVVNSASTVESLTMEQLRGIYNGSITNWNEVGGADQDILPYGRQTTSGTYEFFFEAVMKKEDFAIGVSQETGNAAIATKVAKNAGGIGYIGIGYAQQAQGVKIVPLKVDAASEAFLPTDEVAVYAGDYSLSRHLYVYTDGTPEGAVKTWVEYILSEEGQAVVEEAGFYKLDAETLVEMKAKL